MKAIQVKSFGGPEVLQVSEVADLKPGPTELVVAVKAAGVNPVDTYIRTGNFPYRPHLPYTPGSDAAGVVMAKGEKVRGFEIGERVYLAGSKSGTYAEACLADQTQAYALSDSLSFSQGAAIHIPYATAYRALFHKAKAKKGQKVLVHGASGGVGLAAIQLARSAGIEVVGTAGSDKGLKLIESQGVAKAFNHKDPNYLEEIKAWSQGGLDIILEMLANVNLGKDLSLLKMGGSVIVIGSRGTVEIDPREMMGKDLKVIAMTIMNTPQEEMQAIHMALKTGFDNGSLKPVVAQEMPLKEAPRAHTEIMQLCAAGKIILVP